MRRLPRLRIVMVRQIDQKRSLVDVVDDGGLKVVVAGQPVSTNSGPLRRGVALAICLVRPQPPREELVTLRLHCCWTPDMQVGVRDFERELPVRVTTDLVSKDQPKADSFEPRDICGFVLDIRDGQIDVEDWLGDESVNPRLIATCWDAPFVSPVLHTGMAPTPLQPVGDQTRRGGAQTATSVLQERAYPDVAVPARTGEARRARQQPTIDDGAGNDSGVEITGCIIKL